MKKFLIALIVFAELFSTAPVFAGSATYYDPNLHGKTMANGRPYNKYAYTAAHNSYKLGTQLKVTNRRNGKSVVVTVTDRCGCSIDLSSAAFRAIANKKTGRVPVDIVRLR